MAPRFLHDGIKEADTAGTLGKAMMSRVCQASVHTDPVDDNLAFQTAADQISSIRREIQASGPGAFNGCFLDLSQYPGFLIHGQGQQ